jgi:hypothetical protein
MCPFRYRRENNLVTSLCGHLSRKRMIARARQSGLYVRIYPVKPWQRRPNVKNPYDRSSEKQRLDTTDLLVWGPQRMSLNGWPPRPHFKPFVPKHLVVIYIWIIIASLESQGKISKTEDGTTHHTPHKT